MEEDEWSNFTLHYTSSSSDEENENNAHYQDVDPLEDPLRCDDVWDTLPYISLVDDQYMWNSVDYQLKKDERNPENLNAQLEWNEESTGNANQVLQEQGCHSRDSLLKTKGNTGKSKTSIVTQNSHVLNGKGQNSRATINNCGENASRVTPIIRRTRMSTGALTRSRRVPCSSNRKPRTSTNDSRGAVNNSDSIKLKKNFLDYRDAEDGSTCGKDGVFSTKLRQYGYVIARRRLDKKQTHDFLVRWSNYPTTPDSWESKHTLCWNMENVCKWQSGSLSMVLREAFGISNQTIGSADHKREENEEKTSQTKKQPMNESSNQLTFRRAQKRRKRRYTCENCAKKFCRPGKPTKDTRKGRCVKSYLCDKCAKACSRGATSQKKVLHSCAECGKLFLNFSLLKKHEQLHKRKNHDQTVNARTTCSHNNF